MDEKKISLFYRFIRALVKLFSPKYEITGLENIPEEGCVIVGNHSQMYGPIAMELYAPKPHYIWCAGEMMHREEVADYAFRDFWSEKPERVRWFFWIISRIIPPLSVCIFNNAHTIGVYHDMRVLETFRESVELVGRGAKVVIFPETLTKHNNILYEFTDKFIDLARIYYKKEGKNLMFVPMYLAPKLKKIIYGEPVLYDPTAKAKEERIRINNELMDRITSLALSLPEHKVVPYKNMPKKKYPKSLPLEKYNNEETDV